MSAILSKKLFQSHIASIISMFSFHNSRFYVYVSFRDISAKHVVERFFPYFIMEIILVLDLHLGL